MFLFFFTIFLIYTYMRLWLWSRYHLIILGTLIYVLYLIDDAWLRGTRAWTHLRHLSFLKRLSPVEYYMGVGGDVFGAEDSPRKRYIFMVLPNATNAPLIWGFGLHAGRFHKKLKLRYLLPAFLFYIPILRDFLMWTGAVAYQHGKQWKTITELIQSGHSVAYSCNGMLDAFTAHLLKEREIEVQTPDDALFEFARAENVAIVPVLFSGEIERYIFTPQLSFIKKVQEFFLHSVGYPWPLLYMCTRQSRLHAQILSPIAPHLFDDIPSFKQEVIQCVKSANNTGADKRIVFI